MKFLPPRNKRPLNYSMRRKHTNMTQLLFSPSGNAREELAGAKEFLDEAMREWTKDFHEIDFHREIPCGIQTYFCISLWSKNLFIFGFPPCTSMWHPKSTLILPSQLKYLPLLGHLPLRHISDLSLYSFWYCSAKCSWILTNDLFLVNYEHLSTAVQQYLIR